MSILSVIVSTKTFLSLALHKAAVSSLFSALHAPSHTTDSTFDVISIWVDTVGFGAGDSTVWAYLGSGAAAKQIGSNHAHSLYRMKVAKREGFLCTDQ